MSTSAQQVPVAHITDVDMRQALVQKARGVGNVLVHVQRSNRVELVVLEDVPEPRVAVTIINATARAARLREQAVHNTDHYSAIAPHLPAACPLLPRRLQYLSTLWTNHDVSVSFATLAW